MAEGDRETLSIMTQILVGPLVALALTIAALLRYISKHYRRSVCVKSARGAVAAKD